MKFSATAIAVAVVLAGSASTAKARLFSNSVTTTVGWSEWCPPGVVTVDLDSGRYRWIQQLLRPNCTPEGAAPIVRGTLSTDALKAIREATQVAQAQGLARTECAAGKPTERIVISNYGSAFLLTVVDPRGGIAAPGDISCWSDAAFQLQRLLDREFELPPHTASRRR